MNWAIICYKITMSVEYLNPLVIKRVSSGVIRNGKGRDSYKNIFKDCDTVVLDDIFAHESMNRMINFLPQIQSYLRNLTRAKRTNFLRYYSKMINKEVKISWKSLIYNKKRLFFISIRPLTHLNALVSYEKFPRSNIVLPTDDNDIYNLLHHYKDTVLYKPILHIISCYILA